MLGSVVLGSAVLGSVVLGSIVLGSVVQYYAVSPVFKMSNFFHRYLVR